MEKSIMFTKEQIEIVHNKVKSTIKKSRYANICPVSLIKSVPLGDLKPVYIY
jgi:hypothetical protein